ncbi:hypothetical protein [Chitinophaga pinensis]|nr:hypothetical protein [Chitinophaga pinensis]
MYENGKPSANGLTNIAEMGDNAALGTYFRVRQASSHRSLRISSGI